MLVSQKVYGALATAFGEQGSQYEIHKVLGTGLFGKIIVRARRVYTPKCINIQLLSP